MNRMNGVKKEYLLWFANEHLDFRVPEMSSLQSLFKIDFDIIKKSSDDPYWIIKCDSEEKIKKMASRSVCLKSCVELWGHATTIEELHKKLKSSPQHLYESYFTVEKSFKVKVETFCKHFTQQEKVEKIEQFEYLPFKGPVNLKNPDVFLQYIEFYGTDPSCSPNEPYYVFFGRWICNGLRDLITNLSLKTRKFIGNTSMDPQLSLLMANQAKIRNGDVVLDPFVGSGSLLVAAAQLGASVIGADIDYLMLHARTRPSRIKQKIREKDESIKANLQQYNLQDKYLDVVVADFSLSYWRCGFQFDAILTDPPYGIREATEKVGTDKTDFSINEKHLPTHIPSKVEYGISKIYQDLLVFASKHLKLGGRLVCWFPIFREEYTNEGLPKHPCLEMVANSEQVLSKLTSRRLLTFEKRKEFTGFAENERLEAIHDFREKYFEAREETRNEKRTREAKIRELNRIKYSENKI